MLVIFLRLKRLQLTNQDNEEHNELTEMSNERNFCEAKSPTTYVRKTCKTILAQGFMASLALFMTATNGMTSGFPAFLLPQLQSNSSEIPTTLDEGSWIASMHSVFTPIGSLLSGPMMEHLGRRNTLMITICPKVIGWLCIALAQSHILLLVGRSFTGLATGMSAPPALVLLAEIAEPKLRGFLTGAPSTSFSMGIFTVCNDVALCCSCYIFLCTGEPFMARQNGEQAKHELEQMREQQQHNQLIDGAQSTSRNPLFSRPILRALVLVNVFNFFQEMAGTFTIITYAVNILQQATGGQVTVTEVAVLTALARVILTGASCVMLLHFGRRPMTISSGLGSGAAAIFLSGWLFCAPESENFKWVPAALVVIFVIFNSYGFFMIQGIMIGELFPARARGTASGITCALINTTLFFTTKLYPWMTDVMKPAEYGGSAKVLFDLGQCFALSFWHEKIGKQCACYSHQAEK
ncbi:Hypothetical predicted protein [Cloeon dipterum]|uniref:Major facilitator superfamily (MFS) profile domain-containing protein n=1 Tax=Cloeon dipterum TaxID=197152 RepID=A0A8S1BSJ9_9INSE|nr:Hypothetical predicted protein [Cloeon dipterum]